MHLSTKKLAFFGLLMALTVLFVILSGVLDFNTLFLLAAASFCVGIVIREAGLRTGIGFFIASLLLSLLLAPNKLYCITYLAMALYIIGSEFSYDLLKMELSPRRRRGFHWLIKYSIFNIMYIPMLLLLPKLIYRGSIDLRLLAVLLAAGQAAFLIYDQAYCYFQGVIWGKLRSNLKL